MKINPIKYIAESKAANNYINWALKEKTIIKNNLPTKVTNYSKLQKIYPACYLLAVDGAQVFLFSKSKELPKKRKNPLILNLIITNALAITASLLTNKHIEKFTEKMVKRAEVVYAKNPNKTLLINGIKTGVPFIAAAILFSYLGGVVATPLADKANKYLVKKGLIKYDKNK